MGILEQFRKWLDADYEEDEGKEARPRNKAEEFLVNVAREVERVIEEEMFTPPGGTTYIPREYIVFLSPDDDAEWKGEKRRGLEQGLYHVLSERASLIVGEQQKLQTSSFAVELRVDGTLEKGKFRVQAVWDTEAPKTTVRPRPQKPVAPDAETTIVRPRSAEDEKTIVRPRTLFSVIVNRAGESETKTVNFSQPVISIGRGSREMKVDLPLQGDMEVSRRHATLEFKDGQFKITCEGRNSILIDGAELLQGASTQVEPGQRIEICSFNLRLELPGAKT